MCNHLRALPRATEYGSVAARGGRQGQRDFLSMPFAPSIVSRKGIESLSCSAVRGAGTACVFWILIRIWRATKWGGAALQVKIILGFFAKYRGSGSWIRPAFVRSKGRRFSAVS